MKAFKLTAIVAMAMAVASGFAQGGMRMMGGGGMMGGSPTMTLFRMQGMGEMSIRADIAEELKLTQEQKDKIMDVQDKTRQEIMAMFTGGGGGGNQDQAEREKRMKEMRGIMEKSEKQIGEVMNADQNKRLKELWMQRLGNSAIATESLQKDLGVTDEQKAKIKDLQTKQGEAMRTLFERMRNQEIDQEQMRESMTKNNKIMNDELGKIATDAQKAKIKEMSGKEFKFTEDTN